MTRNTLRALIVLLLASGLATAQESFKAEVIKRGKQATALLQTGVLREGSAFCIDKTGLFVTTAHVVQKALDGNAEIKLLLDTGLATERSLRAKLLRRDDKLDLALLQVDSTLAAQDFRDASHLLGALVRTQRGAGFTALELGKDSDLIELMPVATLGYPSGPLPPGGRVGTSTVAVTRSHITALRKDQGELVAIQLDSRLDPHVSGGPVLDPSGRAIGVVATTDREAAMNRAIPVGRLSEFLEAPKIVFDPPPLSDKDRNRQVTWTIKLEPPPKGKLPKHVAVAVTLVDGPGKSRSFTAQPAAAGAFNVSLPPLPPGMKGVELAARFRTRNPTVTIRTKEREVTVGGDPTLHLRSRDREITIGGKKVKLSELRAIFGGGKPRAQTVGGETIQGPIEGLGKARRRSGQGIDTFDLRDAAEIRISTFDLPLTEVIALVEAKQDAKVLSTLRQRIKFIATPVKVARTGPDVSRPGPVPGSPRSPGNDGVLKLNGTLDVDGVPRGAGKQIQPPTSDIPAARLTAQAAAEEAVLLERRPEGRISDVTVGGGGRYLLLTLKDARKLAVFDFNAADIVKTIPLASKDVIVVAGAKKILVALLNQKRLERWDLATLKRDGDSPLPINGPLKALALGSDSDGPALALWFGDASAFGFLDRPRGSFIDLESLAVLRLGPAAINSTQVRAGVLDSGGSFAIGSSLEKQLHLRASSGGGIFGLWQTLGPNEYHTLIAHGQSIHKPSWGDGVAGFLVPGPDGHTVFTCFPGRLHPDGQFLGRAEQEGLGGLSEDGLTLPSTDPAYYLSIASPSMKAPNNSSGKLNGGVTVSLHASSDGSRLLTVYGLDEMAGAEWRESFLKNDFSIDKRFHFVPAARLLITIPTENDRLVLRRLDIEDALYRCQGEPLIATSAPSILASAGQTIEHQVVAWSKKGGLSYELAAGPDGMEITPDGKLTWKVPRRLRSDELTAVIRARDETGQEIFQTLRIHVRGALIPRPASGGDRRASDEGLLIQGGTLHVTGESLGAGREIRPPAVSIPAARLTPGAQKGSEPPLVRHLGGTIGDVAVGGGGRFLLVALKEARKLAVFDVNAADVVKTIPLPSTNALIAAGANKLLIAFPDEQVLERWDLATLEREGGGHISPIDGCIRALAMGSDSDGPALALWYPRSLLDQQLSGRLLLQGPEARFSFIDLDRLSVLKAGSIQIGKSVSMKESDSLSASGGSFILEPNLGQRRGYKPYLRASAASDRFEVVVLPMQLMIVKAQGNQVVWLNTSGTFDASAALSPNGGFRGTVDEAVPSGQPRPIYIRTADPDYYLSLSGLPGNVAGTEGGLGNIEGRASPGAAVSATVHAAGNGSRLFTVHGLGEMAVDCKMSDWFHDDLTIDKRFHLVPAARLFITIPPTNDCLVIRHLDIDQASDRAASEPLLILSATRLKASAGSKLEHRIVARARKGAVRFELSDGPDGLNVAPDGMVTWEVPARFKGQEATAVITVSEPSGEERFHTIKILVE